MNNSMVLFSNVASLFVLVLFFIYKTGINKPDLYNLEKMQKVFNSDILHSINSAFSRTSFDPRIKVSDIDELKLFYLCLSQIKISSPIRCTYRINRLQRKIHELIILFDEANFWTIENKYYVFNKERFGLTFYQKTASKKECAIAYKKFTKLIFKSLKSIMREYSSMYPYFYKKWMFTIST